MSVMIRTSRQAAITTWLVRTALMVLAVAAATIVAPALKTTADVSNNAGSPLTLSYLK